MKRLTYLLGIDIRNFMLATALLLTGTETSFGINIGPGDTSTFFNDGGADMIAVDLTSPMTLAARTYAAGSFNYQFDEGQPPLGGSVQPILVTGNNPNFSVIALGDTVAFTGATAFISTPFGGSNTFTLAAEETVYAGFFWDGELEVNRSPIGYVYGGNHFSRFDGANPPVVNSVISGGTEIPVEEIERTYDFSITIVPEPASLALATAGVLGLIISRRRRAT